MSKKLALGLGLSLALPVLAQNPATSALFEIGESLTAAQRSALPGLDVLHGHEDGRRRVVVPPSELADFRRLFPEAHLLERGRPFAEILADRAQAGPEAIPSDDRYFTVEEINQEMADLAAQYPDIAKVVNLSALPGASTTAQGRSIFALKVSNRVNEEEDQPAIVIAAQHHCRELNSPFMVIGAMRRLLASSVDDSLLSNVIYENEIYFVPMVNPDGVAHVWTVDNWWRKNRRNNGDGSFGVDLNRNYPTRWASCGSSTSPGSNVYHGPGPASEPETQTMRALAEYV
ncbi:MAG: M14 family zinc carboxypeptidase, partial [Planctomycetota bacterium]